jgi:hypothetical protein
MCIIPGLLVALCGMCWISFQDPAAAPPADLKQESSIVMTYYQAPDVQKIKRFAKVFFKPETVNHPFFAARKDVQENFNVFLGIVAQDSPELVRYYESLWSETDRQGRRLLVQTFFICGDEKIHAQIATWKQGADPILEKELEFLDHFLRRKQKWKRPGQLPARTPQQLDQCWMEFFATGKFDGPARVLDAIDAGDATLRQVAEWSFESLCQSHPHLVKLAKEAQPNRQGRSREFLERILTKAK